MHIGWLRAVVARELSSDPQANNKTGRNECIYPYLANFGLTD